MKTMLNKEMQLSGKRPLLLRILQVFNSCWFLQEPFEYCMILSNKIFAIKYNRSHELKHSYSFNFWNDYVIIEDLFTSMLYDTFTFDKRL